MTEDQIKNYLQNCQNRTEPINTILEHLFDQKKKYQKKKNEEKANSFFIYEECLNIQNIYETSFASLKQKRFHDAWLELVSCETRILLVKRHIAEKNREEYYIDFIERIIQQYQSIYPYKLFLSPEIVKKEKRCNICGNIVSIRKSCGHMSGEIYNGELCHRIVEKMEPIGVALVENPVQKYSVPFMKDPETNETIDQYNYKAIAYLMDRLQKPYDNWYPQWSKRQASHQQFSNLSKNATCPCGSSKNYKECCLKKDSVEIKHVKFLLEKEPTDFNLMHDKIIT